MFIYCFKSISISLILHKELSKNFFYSFSLIRWERTKAWLEYVEKIMSVTNVYISLLKHLNKSELKINQYPRPNVSWDCNSYVLYHVHFTHLIRTFHTKKEKSTILPRSSSTQARLQCKDLGYTSRFLSASKRGHSFLGVKWHPFQRPHTWHFGICCPSHKRQNTAG